MMACNGVIEFQSILIAIISCAMSFHMEKNVIDRATTHCVMSKEEAQQQLVSF